MAASGSGTGRRSTAKAGPTTTARTTHPGSTARATKPTQTTKAPGPPEPPKPPEPPNPPKRPKATGAPRAPQRSGAPRASAYHHGDLRNALLAATELLLDEAGLEGFTLREVARRAGVSHGAPAHHFGDVRGLLSAFTGESFARLAAAMAERRAAAAAGGFEQLVATGVAYVDFALGHRARFQLMFRSDRLDPACEPLIAAGDASYGHLVACIAAIAAEDGGRAPPRLLADRAALAWSIVHGFATLALDNQNFAAHTGGSRARALAMIETLLRMARPGFTDAR